MEVVANNYLPGDQHLVEQIVYELKAQGIFDQFRKECFADVDTKPAYQNLRQRVEGSVSSFLKDQRWKPDMNKNQVREMLRKKITESGFLETGVERIVDQVVNPKINSIFLPKVEEVVYSYLGVQKPSRSETQKTEESIDLLPTDLEAVSPDSETLDKTADKSSDTVPDLDSSNKTEDESPAFEPLDEQLPQEENSVDSHLSGFSGLVSHESDQSLENKVIPMEQDSQMSHNSSESRLSIVTSDETSKVDICEDSSKSVKSESNSKVDEKTVDTITSEEKPTEKNDKNKQKSSDRHKSRSESKSDNKDKSSKSSKDSKPKHSSSSSKDKEKSRDDKSRDKRDSRDVSSKSNKSEKSKEKTDKDRSKSSKSSSSSSNSSSSKDKQEKREVAKPDKSKEKIKDKENDKDKDKIRSGHSKTKDKSSDSKSKEKSSTSAEKHKHSFSSDKNKKDKDKKRDEKNKSKDDHYGLKEKRNGRRSTDRDSNDGQSGKSTNSHISSESNNTSAAQSQKTTEESVQSTENAGNVESTTNAATDISNDVSDGDDALNSSKPMKLFKPKCASNIHEAMRLIKIRKQLAKLEKHNQLSFATVDVSSSVLLKSSIDLDKIKPNGLKGIKADKKEKTLKNKADSERKKNAEAKEINIAKVEPERKSTDKKEEEKKNEDPLPVSNTVISQDSWDAMEAKLREEVSSEFKDPQEEDTNGSEHSDVDICKYFDPVDISKMDFINFVNAYAEKIEQYKKPEPLVTLVEKPTTDKESPTTDKESPTTDKESPTTRVTRKRNIEDAALINNPDDDKIIKPGNIKKLKNDLLKSEVENEKITENKNTRKRKVEVTELINNEDNDKVIDVKNNNTNHKKGKTTTRKMNKKNNNITEASNEKFSLPLSPAESDNSVEPKTESVIPPANLKRSNLLKNQRYSSDDLYKPRPSFGTSRRRGAKITEN